MTPETLKINLFEEVMSTVSDLAPEANKVLAWRQAEFERIGFATYVAQFLAATHIDLQEMRELVEDKGCPLDLAAQILMGTGFQPFAKHADDPQWRWTDEDLDEVVAAAEAAAAVEEEVEVSAK